MFRRRSMHSAECCHYFHTHDGQRVVNMSNSVFTSSMKRGQALYWFTRSVSEVKVKNCKYRDEFMGTVEAACKPECMLACMPSWVLYWLSRLNISLFTLCPGHKFLLPCLIWIIFLIIVVHDPRVCHNLDPGFYCHGHGEHTYPKNLCLPLIPHYHVGSIILVFHTIVVHGLRVCHDLYPRSQCTHTQIRIRAITPHCHVGSWYFTHLLSMTHGCVVTLTQGHISKIKVTVQAMERPFSWQSAC